MALRKIVQQTGSIRRSCGVLLILSVLALLHPPAGHAWLIFHKPEYKGKIIDAETRKPLAGVVVAAVYSTADAISGPWWKTNREIGAQETLTNENGMFIIPEYTAIMSPVAYEKNVKFIIFKPGYSSLPGSGYDKVFPFATCINRAEPSYFPPECEPHAIFSSPIGDRKEIVINPRTKKTATITSGIVGLTRLDDWSGRDEACNFLLPDSRLQLLPKAVAVEKCALTMQWCNRHVKTKRDKEECAGKYKGCLAMASRIGQDHLGGGVGYSGKPVVRESHGGIIVNVVQKPIRRDTLTPEQLEQLKKKSVFRQQESSSKPESTRDK